MRYGIYGGAFDPVHLGHLLLAENCLRQRNLERIIFVPTGVSPHRAGKSLYQASAEDRFQMLESAVAPHEEFTVSRAELDRPGISFTVETLRYFQETPPKETELFLLMGADMFGDLPNWYSAAEICRLATPTVVCRQGTPPPCFEALLDFVTPERLKEIRDAAVDMPLIGISSTKIRQAVASGQSIRFQVPAAVETYISSHQLYGSCR